MFFSTNTEELIFHFHTLQKSVMYIRNRENIYKMPRQSPWVLGFLLDTEQYIKVTH